MILCEFCGKECKNTISLNNHKYHCISNPNRKIKKTQLPRDCVVCGEEFEAEYRKDKIQLTCSYACSNTYFRSGVHAPNQSISAYRTICFRHHTKECVVCEESIIVEVHHYDGDHNNNEPSNLVPVCPTHHKYIHSRHKHLIQDKVDSYVQQYKDKNHA